MAIRFIARDRSTARLLLGECLSVAQITPNKHSAEPEVQVCDVMYRVHVSVV